MGTLVSSILTGGAVALAIPVIAFCLEIIAAVAVSRQRTAVDGRRDGRTPIAVLVPAHNESIGILPTLTDIKRQLLPGDRVLVVADNCSDDTAAVASAAGAQVIERRDAERVGKGYALDFGVRHFSSDPPAIIIFVDADCGLAADSIDHLVRACTASGRPVQAQYLMVSPKNAGINSRVAEFAWRVKNWMRPLGLSHLGLPCQLMGTGMAFPWHVIRSADLAQGLIVEDLQLGLDLAKAGHAPIFCPFARVTSEFASSAAGVATQRARWEHGHIQTILKMVPALLWQSIKGKNTELLALTLDLVVPPLSLLVMLTGGMFLLGSLGALFGFSRLAVFISTGSILSLVIATIFAWLKCGREVLPARSILSIVPYMTSKIGLYARIAFQRMETRWIRTDRTNSG